LRKSAAYHLETSTEKLWQIVLSGQPELEEKLKLPQLRQLRQRIMLRCRTTPLSEQHRQYITNASGSPAPRAHRFFSAKTIETIHVYSLGIPRFINLLLSIPW